MSSNSESKGLGSTLYYLLLDQTRAIVIILSVLAVLYNRDIETCTFFFGCILTSILGMPSSHASNLSFFASYLSCALIFMMENERHSRIGDLVCNWRMIALIILNITFIAILTVRYIERYHSIPQLCAGSIVGGTMGCIWFFFSRFFLSSFSI